MSKSTAAPTSRWLVLVGGAAIAAIAGTALLWARFGTVLFFETIRAGFAACFG